MELRLFSVLFIARRGASIFEQRPFKGCDNADERNHYFGAAYRDYFWGDVLLQLPRVYRTALGTARKAELHLFGAVFWGCHLTVYEFGNWAGNALCFLRNF